MEGFAPGCYGKTAFTRLSLAERELKRMLRRGRHEHKRFADERLNAYHCRDCGHWHIGNGVVRSGQRKGEVRRTLGIVSSRVGRDKAGHRAETGRRFHWRDCDYGDEGFEAARYEG